MSAKYAFEKGLEYLTKQSKEISEELFEYGINLNFAPCIDVNTNPNNPIIGERAFSNVPTDVVEAMQIFVDGEAIVLVEYEEKCVFCGGTEAMADFKNKKIKAREVP